MNILILGTTGFTLTAARSFLNNGCKVRALISMPKSQRPENSRDLACFASEHGIDYHEVEDINSAETQELITQYRPDIMFSSWPKIIKPRIFNIPRLGCIGSHPTALPNNRGRHPLHWLISQGIPRTKLSLFRMDEGIDSGDIYVQKDVKISSEDTIETLNQKVEKTLEDCIDTLVGQLRQLSSEKYESVERILCQQNHTEANYWRKKTIFDVTLDPRLNADQIIRIANSFAPPYPGAKLIYEEHILTVTRAEHIEYSDTVPLLYLEPGKIISTEERALSIKVGDDILRLTLLEPLPKKLSTGSYIHPPAKYYSTLGELGV